MQAPGRCFEKHLIPQHLRRSESYGDGTSGYSMTHTATVRPAALLRAWLDALEFALCFSYFLFPATMTYANGRRNELMALGLTAHAAHAAQWRSGSRDSCGSRHQSGALSTSNALSLFLRLRQCFVSQHLDIRIGRFPMRGREAQFFHRCARK